MINDLRNIVKKFIGIDIGGTGIKGVIINGLGNVLAEGSVPTDADKGEEAMMSNIVDLINSMLSSVDIVKREISGIGIGCPGLIDSKNGMVVFAGNLNLKYYPLATEVSERVGLPVKITNDANAAALGEAKFGAGKKFEDSVLVTLGTGVGGGIVIGGKLFEGGNSAGTEIGHMVIAEDGKPCTCGRRGCFESYASATALMEQTREAMRNNPQSAMWKTYNLQTASGKTAFDYSDCDKAAKSVADNYIKYLACGIINLANIFRPQVIMLGGGVSEQGENLTAPIQKILNAQIMGGNNYAPVKVVKATLGNRAGAFGAAALFM